MTSPDPLAPHYQSLIALGATGPLDLWCHKHDGWMTWRAQWDGRVFDGYSWAELVRKIETAINVNARPFRRGVELGAVKSEVNEAAADYGRPGGWTGD